MLNLRKLQKIAGFVWFSSKRICPLAGMPRAETMMSFRRAEDATYIAQLLGRMVRTPLQCHVLVDDSLNDVRLFLPYFNQDTVQKVIDELQATEGGEIPTVVDGESLEDQTMNMAKSAAKLFEENLRYSNGEPVKVVIADTTIGRVGESAACADKFRKEGVDITLTVTPCWCYGAETMDMDPQTIKAVWGIQRNRKTWCCIPCICTCNTCTERTSGIWYLWT